MQERYPPCSLGLFCDLDDAKTLLSRTDKLAALSELASRGRLLADPLPESLAEMMTGQG